MYLTTDEKEAWNAIKNRVDFLLAQNLSDLYELKTYAEYPKKELQSQLLKDLSTLLTLFKVQRYKLSIYQRSHKWTINFLDGKKAPAMSCEERLKFIKRREEAAQYVVDEELDFYYYDKLDDDYLIALNLAAEET